MNDVQDFAMRVKKFYYYRALLCEKLVRKEFAVNTPKIEMPPVDFNPFANLYVDAYVISCAAIDGLASIWESITQQKFLGNQDRFIKFLIYLDTQNQMNRVCTPFLVFFLKQEELEELFAKEVEDKWLRIERERERQAHAVYEDPSVSEVKAVYEECHRQNQTPLNLSLKNPDNAFLSLTYAGLIYKFYRCSFIHEFRTSPFVELFNTGHEISVRNVIAPKLDIGVGVLTEIIRRGANTVSDLIRDKKLTNISYSEKDTIKFKVKQS